MNLIKLACGFAAVCALGGIAPADAQYPTKPVRMIVPFPPGGGTDTIARVVGRKLADVMGQQVIIDNRPGAGTVIGTELAAKSPPDGYTLLLAAISNAISVNLYRRLNYDLAKDFAPVTLLATTPNVLVVHPSLPVKSVKELIALARARPGELTYSSSGNGTVTHLATALFDTMTGVKMVHVPYKGGGPSMVGLISGEVSLSIATLPSAIPYINSGKLHALAVTTAQRWPSTPKLPTVAEAGVPGYETETWYGLSVPAGTPKNVIARLHADMLKVLKFPDVIQRLDHLGFQVRVSTPEQYGEFTRREIEKWAKAVKAAGVKVD